MFLILAAKVESPNSFEWDKRLLEGRVQNIKKYYLRNSFFTIEYGELEEYVQFGKLVEFV